MTALEKITAFVGGYPGADILRELQIDYTDQIFINGGALPPGLVEISRKADLMGRVAVVNQYNFGLHCAAEKAPGDGAGRALSAAWLTDFREWVQNQSVQRLAPVFGDVPSQEQITAQNGVLYDAGDGGRAVYVVQLCVQFVKYFQATDPWFI